MIIQSKGGNKISRSYKKIPITKDNGKSKKEDKRLANRKVRITSDIPSGCSYKRLYEQYNIVDWVHGNYSFDKLIEDLLTSYDKGYITDVYREVYRRISK